MDIKMQNRINGYFEKLTEFINKIPLSYKGKSYIYVHSYLQFYEVPVLSENGQPTIGIQTEWQLQRFIEQFKKNFQKLRLKVVEKWTDELNMIEPSEAVAKIDIQLYELRKKELLAEIGGEGLNDWENWLIKYFSTEVDYQQKRPVKKLPKQQKKTSYKWNYNKEVELPELYELMTNKYKLIASVTTYEQFEAVFTGQPIHVINKIERTKKFTNVLLTYFVSELFQKSNPNDYLSIAESCFDGAKNLSQAQNNYFYNLKRLPKNHTLIDSLLKDLQNPL